MTTVVIREEHIYLFVVAAVLFGSVGFLLYLGNPGLTGALVLPPSGNLSCEFEMNTSCTNGTKIYAMSNMSNAHAELFNETNYNVSVCCRDLTGSNVIGTGAGGASAITLSNFTNAHAEDPSVGNYSFNVSINASNATMSCTVNSTGEGSCPSGFACLGTLSGTSNAHVANCTAGSAYNITVCCSIGAFISSYFHPDSGFASFLTANGSINGSLVENETSYETQEITYLNTSDSRRYLRVTGQFNLSDVDADALAIEVNSSAIAANVSAVTGISSTHSLFLRSVDFANLGVRVCPGANVTSQIVDNCDGELEFAGTLPQTISGVTVTQDGADYRIDGIAGSGASLLFSVNSTIENSNITNSTFVNATVNNSAVDNSSKNFSIIINSTVNGSANLNCNLTDSVEINSTCSGSSIENSTVIGSIISGSNVSNSNVSGATIQPGTTVINATIVGDNCLSGIIIFNGQTFICPVTLSSIYNPPVSGGQGGGGGAGAGAGASAGSAASSAASSASGQASSKSVVSIQNPTVAQVGSNCRTIVPSRVVKEVPDIPAGFELVGQPEFSCVGSVVDFTMNLPDQYSDLTALRCRKGVCSEVLATPSRDQLLCGNSTLKELIDENIRGAEPATKPSELAVISAEDRYLSSEHPRASLASYGIELVGPITRDMTVHAYLAKSGYPQVPNPSVAMLMAPLKLEFNRDVTFNLRLNVTYPILRGVDVETLALAVLHNGEWKLLGGKVDRVDEEVDLFVEDLSDYVKDGQATFTLLGVLCEACTEGILRKEYSADGARRAVILVHGLTANVLKFGPIIDDFRLNSQPWQVWTFSYPYNRSIEENAREFADLLELHSQEFDDIYFMGHSLGGMITEQALYESYKEKEARGVTHSWFGKVRRVIIAGTPNQGSPTVDVYSYLFSNLFNLSSTARAFNLNASVVDDLARGKSIPAVPGIDYQIIVGTRAIPFTQNLFGNTTNDGVLTPESGYTIGGVAFKNPCDNYYQINITHTDLDDHPTSIRVIERILNQELARERPDVPLVGYNQYLRVYAEDCDPSDSYFVIGKRIQEEQTFDPLLCACGNGVCNVGETPLNCPNDCARFSAVETLCTGVGIGMFPLIAFMLVLAIAYALARYVLGRRLHPTMRTLLYISVILAVASLGWQSLGCSKRVVQFYIAVGAVLAFLALDYFVSRSVKKGVSAAVPASGGSVEPVNSDDLIRSLPKSVRAGIKRAYVHEHGSSAKVKELLEQSQKALKETQKSVEKVVKAPKKVAEVKKPAQSEQSPIRLRADLSRLESFDLSRADSIVEGLPEEVKRNLNRKTKKRK